MAWKKNSSFVFTPADYVLVLMLPADFLLTCFMAENFVLIWNQVSRRLDNSETACVEFICAKIVRSFKRAVKIIACVGSCIAIIICLASFIISGGIRR